MKHTLRSGTFAVALLAGAGLAFAQAPGQAPGAAPPAAAQQQKLDLTQEQQRTIAQKLIQEDKVAQAFPADVGQQVPEGVQLRPMPIELSQEIPEVKQYSFARMPDDRIVLADPQTRQIATVIDPGTVGVAPDPTPEKPEK